MFCLNKVRSVLCIVQLKKGFNENLIEINAAHGEGFYDLVLVWHYVRRSSYIQGSNNNAARSY